MLNKKEFIDRLPHGDVLWSHLQFLMNQNDTSDQEKGKHKERQHIPSQSHSHKIPYRSS